MRIAIIGYGKMGQMIEAQAIKSGIIISSIIDLQTPNQICSSLKSNVDVAIEFTNPISAKSNIIQCIELGIPVVSGSTGWDIDIKYFDELCHLYQTSFFHSSNFSLGMNIFMHINKRLSEILDSFNDYTVNIEETHHINKIDKPSGTALSLSKDISSVNTHYSNFADIPIISHREADVFGNHKVVWSSVQDDIIIEHKAHSRTGFAIGALTAAKFIQNKIGIYNMSDIINL